MRYAALLARGEYITPAELPAELTTERTEEAATLSLHNPAGEEEQIRRALATAGGNKSQAAKLLGISRGGFYVKLKKLGLNPDEYR